MSYKRREHWSIGEVLNLLQDEFPEVTISKIRFLEGQGLIDPERTPSGYRRFYPEDFDRLRWVLIQQRDHYLPLKVIRERLDSGEVVFEEGTRFPETGPEQRTLGFEGEDEDDKTSGEAAPQAEVKVAPAEANAEVDVLPSDSADSASSAPPMPAPVAQPVRPAPAPVSTEVASVAPKKDAAPVKTAPVETASVESASVESVPVETAPVKAEADRPIPEAAAPPKRPKKTAGKKVDRSMNAAVVALSRDELLEEAGCSSALLNELERHGLVHGRKAGSSIVYDNTAVEVAKIGTRFAAHGLDPRHLRSFRLNAEREVGLFSQIVGPQFHRRAPEARQESLDALHDLTGLADSLRSILMTQLVKDEFPGA